MSDPRVDLLAKHIASVLVTLIDIARDGSGHTVVPLEKVDEPVAEAQVQEEPAKRRGRPPKADAAPAAEQTSADEAATPASEPTTATEAGSGDTGRSTTQTPSTTAPSAAEDTLAIAQELTIKLVQAKGRDTAVAALSDFNVGKASALAADQIGAYCEAVRELLAG